MIVSRTVMFSTLLGAVLSMATGCSGNGSLPDRTSGDLTKKPASTEKPAPTELYDDRVKGPAHCPATPAILLDVPYVKPPQLGALAGDRPGTPLTIQIKVVDIDGCVPFQSARVELWHADPGGVLIGDDAARGWQNASPLGVATFQTVYPGWDIGRAPRVYVRIDADGVDPFDTQLFFSADATARVYLAAPYTSRPLPAGALAADPVYSAQAAPERVTFDVTPMGRGSFLASIVVALRR